MNHQLATVSGQDDQEIQREITLGQANRKLLYMLLISTGMILYVSLFVRASIQLAAFLASLCIIAVLIFTLQDTKFDISRLLVGSKRNLAWGTIVGVGLLTTLANMGAASFMATISTQLLASPLYVNLSWFNIGLLAIFTVLLAPFYEEVIFRGILLDTYSQVIGKRAALLVVALLFSLSHGTLGLGLATLPLAITSGLLFIKTGELWNAIFLHGFCNVLAVLPIFIRKLDEVFILRDSVNLSLNFSEEIPLWLGLVGLLTFFVATLLAWYLLHQKDDAVLIEGVSHPRNILSTSLVIFMLIILANLVITTWAAL